VKTNGFEDRIRKTGTQKGQGDVLVKVVCLGVMLLGLRLLGDQQVPQVMQQACSDRFRGFTVDSF
jgi:hypothetical protein